MTSPDQFKWTNVRVTIVLYNRIKALAARMEEKTGIHRSVQGLIAEILDKAMKDDDSQK